METSRSESQAPIAGTPTPPHTLQLIRQQYRYREEIIALLDPRQVWDELHVLVAPFEPVLLCFEHDPSGCHRQIVGRWFEQALNVRVEETG